MFTNLISRIHDCLREEDILRVSVESVKQTLNCDRVVIYSFQPQSMGKIVAEAVAIEYPRTLDTTIDDPCFNARYIDSYRQGRINAIENIQTARITPCHQETLERLAVKANLVVPIRLPNDELYSLLILHQCSQPRVWTQPEITLVAQMAAQIGWALDRAMCLKEDRNSRLSIDRYYQDRELLTTATQKIHRGNTRAEVLQIATAQAQSILTCDRAIVYVATEPTVGKVVAESKLPALSSLQNLTLELPYFEYHYLNEYQQVRVQKINNIYQADLSKLAIEHLEKIAVKANIVVPIITDRHELFGLLIAQQCFEYRNWQDVEVESLRQLGLQTGLALIKAQFQEDLTAVKSSLKRASIVKETVADADLKIQQVKYSVADSIKTTDEARHLMRLLGREVISLTHKLSSEDINLTRIITKKMQTNTEMLTAIATSLQDRVGELSTAIDSANQVYKSRKSR